ncbi:hypothetical protein K443DRAFT_671460 [Laccaria amethystina LaAM-08-1]|jgi:hypothetical protein|uniref:Uncharacterized protein n=1 Tax=Laccaria amethystina LaAM-08-1 TaxID=1095629 RepID=A0A0C9YGS3_9AGAR|nr:hypothetical protein K443DRAFT_671460 [Laccaria amethystina LaAM-08-1]
MVHQRDNLFGTARGDSHDPLGWVDLSGCSVARPLSMTHGTHAYLFGQPPGELIMRFPSFELGLSSTGKLTVALGIDESQRCRPKHKYP